ncbi:hypothetical protein [Streptomyces sp. NPDC059460]|uniref:hypothetical protein n=1 Tax=Streptomyces sp. NPDC059460 TaxID=3346840 RepID=UPI00368D5FAB
MITQLPLPAPHSIFRDDEPVTQSQPLLDGAKPPPFGDTTCWDLNGVLRRPVNQGPVNLRITLHGLNPQWNLIAREMAMIWLNPRHPAVLARGIHLTADPRAPATIRQRVSHLRSLAAFGVEQLLPDDITQWADEDFHRYVDHRSGPEPAERLTQHIVVIKALHQFRRALASGGLERDPWPGKSARRILDLSWGGPLKTPVIKPETWFPLVRAAWTYISTFSPDILRALDRWQTIQTDVRCSDPADAPQRLKAWLDDPGSNVPVRPLSPRRGPINWSLMSGLIGLDYKKHTFFSLHTDVGLARRAAVEQLVTAGRTQAGLLPDLVEVDRPDGSRGPWHASLQPQQLWFEALGLRTACYIFVVALSMIRDSEVREILKGSVVEHFSTPAVKSTKRKLDADLPTKHWWIIQPVADAIAIAEQLSQHPELAFASIPGSSPETLFDSRRAINDFVTRVNRNRHVTGLDEIPNQHITPHMFRRTMAMLTRDSPGAEIAVGMQLKHAATRALANRTTDGYMAKDPSWARYLDDAVAERRFQRLKDLFAADSQGETIGYGPGADRMREAFAAVRQKAEELRVTGQARRGDKRVEHDLLRRTRFSIRFGKLNHCTMNDDDPVGAKCIEDAIVPEGHRGPLPDRCQPSRCANSVIGPEHLPIWKAEHDSLTMLAEDPSLPKNRRALLNAQLHEASLVIKKAEQ